MNAPPRDIEQPHALSGAAVLARLGVSTEGLSSAEASARLARFGPNRLPRQRGPGPLTRLLLQFHNVLIYVLLAAAVLTALLGEWVDSAVIVAVVLINALVGYAQEGKAERALEAIRGMVSPRANVLRDGRVVTVGAEALVPGDIVRLQSGDRVPADLRLLSTKNLRIEEASLTGESLPADKGAEACARDAPLGDRTCIAYSGTVVTFGQGTGVAVATAEATELGRISALLAHTERIETPLLRKLARFGRWLSIGIVAVAVLAFAIGVGLHDYPVTQMFMAAVGLAVAAIPEGLPAIITITLAIGVQRMARRHAIVRMLPAVETLGSVTTVCSDKTGTLTRNEMTVQALAAGEARYAVSGIGYAPYGDFVRDETPVDPHAEPDLRELLRAGLVCNDATLRAVDGQWQITGDPTEAALVVCARKAGLEAAHEAEARPRVDVIPFESEHRFMATLHRGPAGAGVVYLKGAPERVIAMCSRERVAGVDRPLAADHWHAIAEDLASHGQRMLALARLSTAPEKRTLVVDDVAHGLTLLGLVGMVDPPREEAIRAVRVCQAAGIRVKMITGDHASTAAAIAQRLGIGDGGKAVTGKELDRLDDAALRRVASTGDVYARVSPEHKLRLVRALQANGEIVAMTGDGVNDAPALKRADVGVAMGITGTEAAKEAAEVVLADDNFASIAAAIEEGRTIYDNLRKTILFILPTNGGEAFILVTAIALGMALPILPVQILWVNMVTAVTLALALSFEPAEPSVMRRPPRAPDAPIFSRYFMWRTLFVSLLMVVAALGLSTWEQAQGASAEAARTAVVNVLVVIEAFYLLNTRFLVAAVGPRTALRGNPYVSLMIVLVIALQLVFTYAPFMHAMFHTVPLTAGAWRRIAAAGLAAFLVIELEKAAVRAIGLRVG